YRELGVVTAQAVLPPQDLSDGAVRIQLIEGRIGKYDVEGNASTRTGYVLDHMSQGSGELVDLPTLERDIEFFNRMTSASLRAELRPGAEVGETDVLLEVVEPPRHSLRFTLD